MSAPGSLAGCGAAALLAALLAAWPAMGQAAEPLAARVNGAGISRQRLDRFTEEHAASQGRSAAGIQSPRVWRRLVREALDQLVDDELLGQEAVRLGHAPAPEVVERALAEARAAFPLPVQFELRLERAASPGPASGPTWRASWRWRACSSETWPSAWWWATRRSTPGTWSTARPPASRRRRPGR
ncbi:MAG: SurA N-terminal domain-containing protein [Anaeromyxobacter sp.]|nr:SurA N-terminal domain-containing protein [Anaeromyxobacter sp.]